MKKLFMALYEIKSNPKLFFGCIPPMTSLRAWIDGYIDARREMDVDFEETYRLGGFQEFVAERYNNLSVTRSWDSYIRFFSASDEEAFNTFYRLLDEFLAQQNQQP